jgi:hypothetical protein
MTLSSLVKLKRTPETGEEKELKMKNMLLGIVLCLSVISCGEPQPDEKNVSESSQAVSNPYQCVNGYDPIAQPWPTHGWCTFQPNPSIGPPPPGVGPCDLNVPPFAGQVDLYTGDNFTGQCARITGPAFNDWTQFALNGWNAHLFGGFFKTTIRSMMVGSTGASFGWPVLIDTSTCMGTQLFVSQLPGLQNYSLFTCFGTCTIPRLTYEQMKTTDCAIHSIAGFGDNSYELASMMNLPVTLGLCE